MEYMHVSCSVKEGKNTTDRIYIYIYIYVCIFADTILHYVIKRRWKEGTSKKPIPKGKFRRFILIIKMHAQLMLRAKKGEGYYKLDTMVLLILL